MSQTYTPQRKALIMNILAENNFNIALTSQQTSVPQRTLREWRHDLLAQYSPPPLPPTPTPAAAVTENAALDLEKLLSEVEDDAEILLFARNKIMRYLVHLTSTLNSATPYSHVLMLTQLIQHLDKLNAQVQHLAPAQEIRITYQYPEDDPAYWNSGDGTNDEDEDEEEDDLVYKPRLSMNYRPGLSQQPAASPLSEYIAFVPNQNSDNDDSM